MAVDKERRRRAEDALELLEDDGWSIRDYDVNETGPNGVKLSLEVYTYDRD